MSYLADPVFHSLEELRSNTTLAGHIGAWWRERTGDVPVNVSVTSARAAYEPFVGAVLQATASVSPGGAVAASAGDGTPVDLGLYLAVFADDQALADAVPAGRDGSAPQHLSIPACRAVGWALPDVPSALDLGWATHPGSVPALLGDASAGSPAAPEFLALHPSRRAEFRVAPGRGNEAAERRLIVVPGERFERVCRIYREVERMAADGRLAADAPSVVAVDPERGAVIVDVPTGRSFASVLESPFREPVESVGAALASLHACELEHQASSRGISRRVDACAARLLRAFPELSEALAVCREALARTELDAVGGKPVSIHGRFDAGAVVMAGKRVGICKWERLRAGEPARDIATMIAQIIDSTLAAGTPASVTRVCVRALLEAYYDAYCERSGTPREAIRSRVREHLAGELVAALLMRAGDVALRRLDGGWKERCLALVEEAASAAGGGSRYLRGR